MNDNRIKFLSAAEVARCLPMNKAIAAMREAFIAFFSGKTVVPERIHTEMPEYNGTALFMPVYSPDQARIGLKVVTVSRDNPSKNLPQIHALVLVFDAATGRPLAVMDGAHLTALRTGAASGLATDLLAAPQSKVAAVFGAGVQGRTQLVAVCSVRPIEEANIFDPDLSRAEKFAEAMQESLGISITVSANTSDLARADVICTATTSSTPVFDDQDIKSGVHINGVGSYKPDMQEIPAATVIRSHLIVDSRKSCLAEAGDLLVPMKNGLIDENHIKAELGEIASGDKPGRTSENEITMFKSVGNAVQDLTAAEHILHTADKMNLGTELSL